MVTDVTAYIGTSNWSGDYFINTAGNCLFHFTLFSFLFSSLLSLSFFPVILLLRLTKRGKYVKSVIDLLGVGMVLEAIGDHTSDNLRQQLENIFHRDWYSEYSYALNGTLPFVERSTNTIEDDYYLRSSRYILA